MKKPKMFNIKKILGITLTVAIVLIATGFVYSQKLGIKLGAITVQDIKSRPVVTCSTCRTVYFDFRVPSKERMPKSGYILNADGTRYGDIDLSTYRQYDLLGVNLPDDGKEYTVVFDFDRELAEYQASVRGFLDRILSPPPPAVIPPPPISQVDSSSPSIPPPPNPVFHERKYFQNNMNNTRRIQLKTPKIQFNL